MAERWRSRFFTIWIGQQLSLVGSRAARFALVWWLTTTTGSATVLAAAAMVAMLPQIVLGPFVGTLVDRWNRRAVMIAADGFIALVSLWLAYLFWVGSMELWHVYVVMLATSFGEAFHGPAMAASTSLMVPARHYTRIGGLNQTIHGLLAMIGPPLGALLLSCLPIHGVMLVDVGTAAFAIATLLLTIIPQPKAATGNGPAVVSFLGNVREGLRFVRSWPGLIALLAGASLLKIALIPALQLAPLLVADHFGGDAAELGLFNAMAGAGLLAGGMLLAVWGGFGRKIYTILTGLLGIGIASIVVGLAPAHLFAMAIAGIFVLGAMVSLADGPILALLQATVPPEMQGRVFALLGSLFSLTTPIGLMIAGPVADATGVPFWFVLGGGICAMTAAVSFFIPALIQIEEQTPAAAPVEDRPPARPAVGVLTE